MEYSQAIQAKETLGKELMRKMQDILPNPAIHPRINLSLIFLCTFLLPSEKGVFSFLIRYEEATRLIDHQFCIRGDPHPRIEERHFCSKLWHGIIATFPLRPWVSIGTRTIPFRLCED